MPDIPLYREWCASCQDYTEHDTKFPSSENNMKCVDCDTECKEVALSDIPIEKVEEQRKRYKMAEEEQISMIGKLFSHHPTLLSMSMFSAIPNRRIIETDAGQKDIDAENIRINLQKSKKRAEQREKDLEAAKKFEKLNRNDPCACGSGIKYKKCCLNKVRKLK